MDTVEAPLKETEGIALDGIPKEKGQEWEGNAWVPPLVYGIQVEPNIEALGVIVEIKIVPLPSIERGVCALAVLIAETVFPAVAIERKGYRWGLVGL